jgi:Tol biopolymer transport system component
MTVAAGTRFGQYEIVALLGAGGMGEVYRARDARLARDVAVKILPATFAADPDRLARFEREARLLASLNHPNIGAIYGVEETGGLIALVLELVEGETLDDRVRSRESGLGIRDSLVVARQIADALDAAHQQGIVHRDLKPANIKMTPGGQVKLLDFGLAKGTAGSGGSGGSSGSGAEGLTHSPTVMPPTMDGVLLGTAPYMSPEQARGRAVDKRTDIWAFGCVLYEMLTGRHAFPGETTSDTIVAILDREPDWTVLPPETPFNVRRLLRRCLDKDSRQRLRDIGDARIELDDSGQSPAEIHASPCASKTRLAAAGIAGAAAATLAIAAWSFGSRPIVNTANVQLQRITDTVGLEEAPAISPDGKTIAYVASDGAHRQIWVRLITGGSPLQITRDNANHEAPRWAPDSSALIYFTSPALPGEAGAVSEVAALGGPPRILTTALTEADISHDGRRLTLFQLVDGQMKLVTMERDGSGTRNLADLGAVAGSVYETPRWSPDDRWIAYQSTVGTDFDKRIFIVAATGGDPRAITRASDGRGLSWLPDNSGIVYSSPQGSTVLYPPTFNLRMVRRDGSGERQLTFGDLSYLSPDVHASGIVAASRLRSQSDVWRFPTTGAPADNTRNGKRITHQTGSAQTPAVSPDNAQLAYLSDTGGHGNVWVVNTDGANPRQITFERDPDVSVGVVVWSSTSNAIDFLLARGGTVSQWMIRADGSGRRQLTARGVTAAWSRDDRWLYTSITQQDHFCIEKTPVNGGPAVSVRCDDAAGPMPGPDGSTLYYTIPLKRTTVGLDWEVRRARPEDAPSVVLGRVAGSRVPVDPLNFNPILSPDGRWLVTPLIDNDTTNLWLIPTDGGAMRPITDFGARPVIIARRVTWSPDSMAIYAAVAEVDADIVLLSGLIR